MADRLRTEGSGFLLEQPPPLLSDGAAPELWDRVLRIVRAQPAEAIAAATLGMAERPDSTPDLPGIDVPTLVIASMGDRLIPSTETTPLADAIPDATVRMLEGAGHLSNIEAPEPFDAALLEHLRRCGLPA
jgi:pimeloyl-ACP methyl ester carboxylesterase